MNRRAGLESMIRVEEKSGFVLRYSHERRSIKIVKNHHITNESVIISWDVCSFIRLPFVVDRCYPYDHG